MEKRTQLEGRKFFWIGQRKKILRKTGGHCAHCGIKLQLKDMSPDHVVPLSKGGTNDLKNIVPLCKSCNDKKRNFVMSPESWFPYLSEESLAEVTEYYDWYQKNYDFIAFKNFVGEDVFKPSGANRQERRKKKINPILHMVVKQDLRDEENIQNFFIKYSSKVANNKNLELDKGGLEGFIKENGVYAIKLGGEISAIVAIRIGSPDVGVVCPIFFIYTLYKRYTSDIIELCYTVYENLSNRYKDNENSEFPVAFMICNDDPSKQEIEKVLQVKNPEYNSLSSFYEEYNAHVTMYLFSRITNRVYGQVIKNGFVEEFREELEKDCVPEMKNYYKLLPRTDSKYEVLRARLCLFIETLKISLDREKLRKKRYNFSNAIVYSMYGEEDRYWKEEVLNFRMKVFKVVTVMVFVVVWFVAIGVWISKIAFNF